MKKHKLIGILLICVGIILAFALISLQVLHCYEMWTTEFKADHFNSFLEHFFAVSKGAILVSLFIGVIPTVAGVVFYRKK